MESKKFCQVVAIKIKTNDVDVSSVVFNLRRLCISGRGVHKLPFFWPSQVTNHKSSEQVNSQITSKSLVQVQV